MQIKGTDGGLSFQKEAELYIAPVVTPIVRIKKKSESFAPFK
jgi:hypothetical protein